MNTQLLHDLADKCRDPNNFHQGPWMNYIKFAEMLLEDVHHLLQEEWYRLNNLEHDPNETLRDVGMRVGKKSEIVHLQTLIRKHFGE